MDARLIRRRRGGAGFVSLAYAYALPQAGWQSMQHDQDETAAALQQAGLWGGWTVQGGVERPQAAGAVLAPEAAVVAALNDARVRNLLKSVRPVSGHAGHAEWLANVA